jgi:hypothetical protein
MIEYYGIKEQIDMKLLKIWYNNYQFSREAKEKIYNTDMVLYYISSILQEQHPPYDLIDINVRSDYSTLQNIIYTDGKLNGNFENIKTLIGGRTLKIINLVQDFSALELRDNDNFISLLFYLGLITINKGGLNLEFKIPNETIKRIDIDFLKNSLCLKNIFCPKVYDIGRAVALFAKDGKLDMFEYIANAISKSTSIRDYINNEQSIKDMMLAYLSLTPILIARGELELNKGYADITILPINVYVMHYAIVEIKYIKRGDKQYKSKIDTLVKEATKQLEQYSKDEMLKPYKDLTFHKVVMVFWGWELVEIREV